MLINGTEINENHEMIHEEDLTRYGMLNDVKIERENQIMELTLELQQKMLIIQQREEELYKIAEGKKLRQEKQTMPLVGAKYFEKEKSSFGGAKNSVTSPRLMTGASGVSRVTGVSKNTSNPI